MVEQTGASLAVHLEVHSAARSVASTDASTAVLLAVTWVGLMDSSLVVHLAAC